MELFLTAVAGKILSDEPGQGGGSSERRLPSPVMGDFLTREPNRGLREPLRVDVVRNLILDGSRQDVILNANSRSEWDLYRDEKP